MHLVLNRKDKHDIANILISKPKKFLRCVLVWNQCMNSISYVISIHSQSLRNICVILNRAFIIFTRNYMLNFKKVFTVLNGNRVDIVLHIGQVAFVL